MPRYFFDTHDGVLHPDNEGTEHAHFASVRKEAMAALPEIARWVIPARGDNQAFTVLVRNESGAIVYTAR